MSTDEILHRLYYIEHNLDGVAGLTSKAKQINKSITKKEVEEWLKRQESYQLNYSKPTKRKTYLPIYSENPNAWQLDLTFIPQYKKQNRGNYVLFTAINITSRYGYVSFSTNKKASTILALMKDFVDLVHPEKIDGDKGSEYINKEFTDYLRQSHIESNFYKSDSHKLGIINRFHRTLKEKITKWMSASGSVTWINVINDLVLNYNKTSHRGIRGATPLEVFESPILQSLLVDDKKAQTAQLNDQLRPLHIDDFVRVLKNLKQFENRMTTKYSSEIYQVVKVNTNTVNVIDELNHLLTFKKSQVQKINPNIENVQPDVSVKARMVNRKERLVRKEDLIDAPTQTRTRGGGKHTKKDDIAIVK